LFTFFLLALLLIEAKAKKDLAESVGGSGTSSANSLCLSMFFSGSNMSVINSF
jgi:hypothetical protein